MKTDEVLLKPKSGFFGAMGSAAWADPSAAPPVPSPWSCRQPSPPPPPHPPGTHTRICTAHQQLQQLTGWQTGSWSLHVGGGGAG